MDRAPSNHPGNADISSPRCSADGGRSEHAGGRWGLRRNLHRSVRVIAPLTDADPAHAAVTRREQCDVPGEQPLLGQGLAVVPGGVERHLDDAVDVAIRHRQAAGIQTETACDGRAHLIASEHFAFDLARLDDIRKAAVSCLSGAAGRRGRPPWSGPRAWSMLGGRVRGGGSACRRAARHRRGIMWRWQVCCGGLDFSVLTETWPESPQHIFLRSQRL